MTDSLTITPNLAGSVTSTPAASTIGYLQSGIEIKLEPNVSVSFDVALTAKDPLPGGFNIGTNESCISGDVEDCYDSQTPLIPGKNPEEELTKTLADNKTNIDGDGNIQTVSSVDVLTYELAIGPLTEDAIVIQFEYGLESVYLSLVEPDGNISVFVDG